MSQLVRLEGKHTTQNAHCALEFRPWRVSLPKLFPIFFNNFRFVQIQIQVLLSKSPGDRLWRLCNSSQHFLCHLYYECNWNFSISPTEGGEWTWRTPLKSPKSRPSPERYSPGGLGLDEGDLSWSCTRRKASTPRRSPGVLAFPRV